MLGFQCIEGIRTSDAFDLEPLTPGQEKLKWIHIDFGDGKRSSVWNLKYEGSQEVSLVIDARMGEQIEPICMNTEEFTKEAKHLSGMNEHTAVLGRKVYPAELYKIANCNNVTDSEDDYCAQTLSKKQLVLISVGNELTVRCENYMLASFLCKEIESFFAREFSREPLAPNDEISQISHCRKTTEASLPQ
ncbi:hypothetical protein AB6A40_009359 [Gnathostoma spinigerum]|uniref:AP-3 complex subunit beta-1/2 C-terminal domain-containing protein n=1 Tax=Gnathostoma spinigerum TaxID=75299 RepID=A0ABD6F1G6_9BILA